MPLLRKKDVEINFLALSKLATFCLKNAMIKKYHKRTAVKA